MSFGKYTYGKPNTKWGGNSKLIVGKFCSIANNVTIYLGGNHKTDWITTYPFGTTGYDFNFNVNEKGHPFSNGNVIVGNDVWIGDNVTIMSGVLIGDGSIIACNSHVVKNVEPYYYRRWKSSKTHKI
jgi:acetyltransferase-like isoleucine patch superfamily enzyme